MGNDAIKAQLEWAENGVVFVTESLRDSSFAQSLAALMTTLCEKGKKVWLVTYERPAGEDYVTSDEVKRFVINLAANAEKTKTAALTDILAKIPCKTVVLWPTYQPARAYLMYRAIRELGRTLIFATNHSPLQPLASGDTKYAMQYELMLRDADAVTCISRFDEKYLRGLGLENVHFIRFLYPYFDYEITPDALESEEFSLYVTNGSQCLYNMVTAFMRVHERHPQTVLNIIPVLNFHKTKAWKSFSNWVQRHRPVAFDEAGVRSTPILLHGGNKRPYRFVGGKAGVFEYTGSFHMPYAIMEAASRGIPAYIMRDGDYSEDDYVCGAKCLSAGDTDGFEKELEALLDREYRLKMGRPGLEMLRPEVQSGSSEAWNTLIDETAMQHSARADETARAHQELLAFIKKDKRPTEKILRELLLHGELPQRAATCLVQSGRSLDELSDAFMECALLSPGTTTYIKNWQTVLPYVKKLLKKGTVAEKLKAKDFSVIEMIGLLTACGLSTEQVLELVSGVDPKCFDMLLEASLGYDHEAFVYSDVDGLLLLRGEKSCDPAVMAARSAIERYVAANNSISHVKKRRLVRFAAKHYAWVDRRIRGEKFSDYLLSWPTRGFRSLKKHAIMLDKKRLEKREVTEVDPADIRKIQMLVLKMLLEMDRICKKHNLTYYVAGGSILGGVRHKGFIPWDDDMDITMPRPDYDKFIDLCQTELGPEFIMERDCVPYCHNRMEIRGTYFHPYLRKGRIFLDVLALEGSPDDEALMREHEKKCNFWRRIMLAKARPYPALRMKKDVIMIFIKRFILKCFVPRFMLKKIWYKWASKYSVNDCDNWVCLPASIYSYERERFPKETWGTPVPLEFEGYSLPTMAGWETYLVEHYGDYMKMPPITKRKSHHYIYGYDLGPYKDMTTEELEAQVLGKKLEETK